MSEDKIYPSMVIRSQAETIELLEKENKQLQNNWNELKEYCLNEQIPEEYDEYNSYIEFSNSVYENVLDKMKELEQGKDE